MLLLPLLLVALVPQGFMPTVSSDGWFTVTICTTDGLRTVTLDENGQEVPGPAGQTDENAAGEHCLFTTLTVLAAPAETGLYDFQFIRKSDGWPFDTAPILPGKTRLPLGARAPPILA